MPLVEYLGNATPQDNTEVISLNDAEDGSPRSIARGGRALVSGQELRALAANYQIRVVENGDEKKLTDIPAQMPDGYEDDGYKKDEAHSDVVFTPEAYPDEGVQTADVRGSGTSPESSSSSSSGSASAPAPTSAPSSPAASPTPVTPSAAPTTSPSSPSPSAPASSDPSPASPGASG